jgi:cytochrome b subunit of formate dehydrogenase
VKSVANLNTVLLKTVRITSWPLLVLMVLYLVTGYTLCGQPVIGDLMSVDKALAVHRFFDIPLVILFLGHSLPGVYLEFVRWGWIGRRNKT